MPTEKEIKESLFSGYKKAQGAGEHRVIGYDKAIELFYQILKPLGPTDFTSLREGVRLYIEQANQDMIVFGGPNRHPLKIKI